MSILNIKFIRNLSKGPNIYPRIVFGFILFGGLLVRLYGIDFGLPYRYSVDEGSFVGEALNMLRKLDFNPYWFGHPGTTTMYLLVVLYVVIYLGGLIFGVFSNPHDFRVLIDADPTIVYLSGRLLFALVGVATIPLVYFNTRRIFNKQTGLIASAFLAFNTLHVYYSKLIRTDILMTFFLLISFLFCLRILEKRAWSDYIIAGLVTGFAISTKYPSVVIILVIIAAHILSAPSQWAHLSKLFASGLACLIGIFISSPYLFLDFGTVLKNVVFEARPIHLGATGSGFFNNFVWYIGDVLWRGFEPANLIYLILATIGVLLCLSSMKKDRWLLIAFPVFFLLFISALSLRWERWIIPIVPFLCMLAAHPLQRVSDLVAKHSNSVLRTLVCLGLTAGLVIPVVRVDLVLGRMLSNKDTRTLAREWIMDNIPAGSRLLIERLTPQLPKERYVFFQVKDGYPVKVDTSKIREAVFIPRGWTNAAIGTLIDPESVKEKNIQYMVLATSWWYDQFLAEKDKIVEYVRIVATYETLMNMASKIYEVKPTLGENRGHTIQIYQFSTAHIKSANNKMIE